MNLSDDAARRWIVANMVPTALAAVATLAVYLIGRAMGVPGADAALPAQAVYVILQTAVLAASLILYAQMTGPVLAANIPLFPQRSWSAMHLTLGLVAGFVSGLAMLGGTDPGPFDWSDTTALVMVLFLMLGLGAVAGAAFGGLQALVLRRAAQGLGFWILCWVIAVSLAIPVGGLIEMFVPGARSLRHEAVTAVMTVVVGLIGALILLPAVRRLRPKG